MFLGVNSGGFMGVGNLINANAISLLKANAYQAAKQVIKGSSESTLQRAAEDYAKFVIPRTNRALSVPEIVRDYNFKRIATEAKSPKIKTSLMPGGGIVDFSDLSLSGSVIGSIPNWLIYAGGAYYAYRQYRKKHGGVPGGSFLKGLFKKKSRSRRRSSRRVSLPPPAPVIGA